MSNFRQTDLIYKIALVFGLFAVTFALSGYVITGSYMRYSGDDYCYGAFLTQYGFWGAQVNSFLIKTPFHGNRYSLNLISGLSGLFGPYANGVLPGLAVLLWIIGGTTVILQARRLLQINLSHIEALLIAEFLVFITLFQVPDVKQSLYWRSSMLPYLAPLIVNTILFGYILHWIQKKKLTPLAFVIAFVLALLGGGFSETGVALQAGYLTLAFIAAWIGTKVGWKLGRHALYLAGIALLGTLLSFVLLIAAPTNPPVDAASDPIRLIFLSFDFAGDFIRESFQGLPLPNFVNFVFFAGIAALFVFRQESPFHYPGKPFLRNLLWVAGISFFLTVCCIAPTVYVYSRYPSPRALTGARYAMVLGVSGLGVIIGTKTAAWLKTSWPENLLTRIFPSIGMALLLCSMGLYTLRAGARIYQEIPRYQEWGSLWDSRDQEIRAAREQGIKDVEVEPMDKIITWVAELSENPGAWYNICAANYYGVNSIRATK